MNGSFSREKGKRGEREVINALRLLLPDREIARNLQQTREGGADILGTEPFAIEVKNQKRLQVAGWWRQAKEQANRCNLRPALVFKSNHKWVVKIDDTKNYITLEKLSEVINGKSKD